MADNPDRLAQIMQRMQVSNQRSVGNRLGGANGANAPTPPSEQIDFTKNTLSPPSMAQPDDTGPGQQMPSVIQPPASGNVGMPSGGNAYSGNQQGVSPSTRDLYSLPDYSGGMGGGNSGGGFDVGRLLKMLSSYMGSQNGQPSPAPPPAPSPSPNMQSAVGSNGLDFGMTNDPAEQARRQAQQRMDFQAANPGQSMSNALKGLTPGGPTGASPPGLDIPSLSSLDGRSPQAMPSTPATMGDEYQNRMIANDERLNKYKALSEQEKASLWKNATFGH